MIDVFERSNMPTAEADEWRRKIVVRPRFLALDTDSERAD
jgi:hypothetical protein